MSQSPTRKYPPDKYTNDKLLKMLKNAKDNSDSVSSNMIVGELLVRGVIKRKNSGKSGTIPTEHCGIGKERFDLEKALDKDYIIVDECEKADTPADKEYEEMQEKWK